MNKTSPLLLALLLSFSITNNASAGDEWDTTLGIQGSKGNYSGSSQRDKKSNYGIFFTADYLDSYGLTFVYDRGSYDYKNDSFYSTQYGKRSIDQDSFFLSGRKTFRPDSLNGLLTLSLDAFHIDNNDRSKLSDNVKVYGSHLSYLTFDKKYYVDLGYANSSYYDGLTIDQWTPTGAIGFNQQRDWLQVRGYFISSSDRKRTQGYKSTEAVDISLTHYFDGQTFKLNQIKLSGLIGERFYAVDRDSANVYNLDDIQKGSLSLLAEFQLTEKVKLTISGGKERFRSEVFSDSYSSNYLYGGISTTW